MKKMLAVLRFFFVGPEFLLVVLGVFAGIRYAECISVVLRPFVVPGEPLKYVVMIPPALCCWSFVSGRKLLFPEKDKSNVILDWPDYWLLKIGFGVALAWNVLFALASIAAWFSDWSRPGVVPVIVLVVSIFGSSVSFLSVYNAQNAVDEAVGRFREKGG